MSFNASSAPVSSLPTYDTRTEKCVELGIIFTGLAFGVHTALFLSCLRPVFKRDRKLFAYICVLFTLSTIGIGLQIWWHEVVFIDNRDYPGGPFEFLKQTSKHPAVIIITVIYILLNWSADGILLYRFYVIYSVTCSHCCAIMICCGIVLLSLIATGCVFMRQIANLGLWIDYTNVQGIAYLTLSLSVNVILTFLIVGRILLLRRRIRAMGPQFGKHYTCVVAVLVESASLYTVWALITVIACGINSPMQYTLLPVMGQLQAIPPLLITVRVASGHALSRDTLSSPTLSLRFSSTTPSKSPASEHFSYEGREQKRRSPSSLFRLETNLGVPLCGPETPSTSYSDRKLSGVFDGHTSNSLGQWNSDSRPKDADPLRRFSGRRSSVDVERRNISYKGGGKRSSSSIFFPIAAPYSSPPTYDFNEREQRQSGFPLEPETPSTALSYSKPISIYDGYLHSQGLPGSEFVLFDTKAAVDVTGDLSDVVSSKDSGYQVNSRRCSSLAPQYPASVYCLDV